MNDIRPATRSECLGGLRPCPWISCRWHMISVIPQSQLKGKTDDAIVEKILKMKESCILDLCDRGGLTLDVIGKAVGVSRERIRQLTWDDRPGKRSAMIRMRMRHRMEPLRIFTITDGLLV